MIHTLQLVVMNTNRDHGTELALDEGSKQEQRNFFRDMIIASRFQICSELVKEYSMAEAQSYKELAKTVLERIDATDNLDIVSPADTLSHLATWSGDMTGQSYPSNYLALRRKFQKAAREGDWTSVWEIIEGEYEWEIAEWFNLPALEYPWTGRTLLHEMAFHGPPQQLSKHEESWRHLIDRAMECEAWSVYPSVYACGAWSHCLLIYSRRNSKNCGYNANRGRDCSRKLLQRACPEITTFFRSDYRYGNSTHLAIPT
jgi:hypothetical protein